jgi:hypothetical protein
LKISIIAPSAFHHLTWLLGEEDAVKVRLRASLEKERWKGVEDGLGVGTGARWEGGM